jgi:hypothetical protein
VSGSFDPKRTGSHQRAHVMRNHLLRLSASLQEEALRRSTDLATLDLGSARAHTALARSADALAEQLVAWQDGSASVEQRMRDLLAYQDIVSAARLLGVEAAAA